ncbi:hypothetical protein GCK72_016464 [Caenorhabditis remanei]|uniref:Uncharacterized protein n=1 Tax=Caenorhabditis remanei TaxID=31234 RepID=A0A6A5G5Z5_CAERE|nr:hypothetical protein GCK72_016464 [Caenorhabditis remanei]KAF1749919.1 hypothetical protein GCK72_016464 [Caenorhabditis remanei]
MPPTDHSYRMHIDRMGSADCDCCCGGAADALEADEAAPPPSPVREVPSFTTTPILDPCCCSDGLLVAIDDTEAIEGVAPASADTLNIGSRDSSAIDNRPSCADCDTPTS